jgi:hypothetical protein
MAGPPRSWVDLPLEVAGLVLGRLPSHADRVRFATVWPQWRSAARQVRLPPPPPLLALKNGRTFYSMPSGEPLRLRTRFPGYDDGYTSFSPEDSDFATASGNWLVYRRMRSLLLVDPFTGATMTLPAPSSVNLPDNKGGDSKGGYDSANHVGDDSEDGYDSDGSNGLSMAAKHFEVIKLMVCSPNLIAALFWSCDDCNYIAVCRPGASLGPVFVDY